tara:strand:- start:647 stop:850 length:204 start_codon:yes stop_codon:yes gene_type:complete
MESSPRQRNNFLQLGVSHDHLIKIRNGKLTQLLSNVVVADIIKHNNSRLSFTPFDAQLTPQTHICYC